MTDTEAIEYAGKELQRTGYTLETNGQLNNGLFKILSTKFEFLVVAISALQEREERARGCRYCSLGADMKDGEDMEIDLFNYAEGMDFSVYPNFCPMCGRKLKTAMPGEEQHGV